MVGMAIDCLFGLFRKQVERRKSGQNLTLHGVVVKTMTMGRSGDDSVDVQTDFQVQYSQYRCEPAQH